MGNKVFATARIQITVEFPVGGQSWNPDAAIEQVHRQAYEAAIEILAKGISIHGAALKSNLPLTRAEVVGDPKVTAILVEAIP